MVVYSTLEGLYLKTIIITTITRPGTMAHVCNPSYFGGRDQEDYGSRSVQKFSGSPS
jgi:hypothetical protein